MKRHYAYLALVGLSLIAGGAQAQAPAKAEAGMLVDAKGMTLYTFDKDSAGSGKSVCNDACAKAWPPLVAPAGANAQGDWSIVTRDDGSKQWAYKGKPLYLFAKDSKAGEKAGDNVKDVWHIVKP
ncbi:hypothetical protein [Bordetella holmesii]|uniref:Lipoprotein with Yx(FWY)xxD motif n=2 Tax=Bordetella holmesii TaxID=35814 RepID=A0ABP3BFN6_9BORD|nr:hypothetical protein [Bordetella holmesii]AHV94669.1 secreted repeat of unknown function family protein [Bordetella holmesii ATCC 51541]AIT27498.1 secreted repeat of unknown function family protein [Bordetella holmesii 44057]EWM43315.1 secreted repeat of unknown function family protein [Bordetella holmesii 41130]EWM48088.1 secreted repeat of unknown function family protein [Bordetella holmesii 35009]EWM49072.1 secreted repeat of unknown function family protein [Bordetella holmesii 70147]